jgi:hypothetical protein
METKDFEKTYGQLTQEKLALIQSRTNLETELVEVRNKIRHLDQILSHLAPLAEVDWVSDVDGSIDGLGLTDSIRHVLRNSESRMSPREIFDALKEKGYDFSELTAPMQSIYKILSRLEGKEVEKEEDENRVYYKWIGDPAIPF